MGIGAPPPSPEPWYTFAANWGPIEWLIGAVWVAGGVAVAYLRGIARRISKLELDAELNERGIKGLDSMLAKMETMQSRISDLEKREEAMVHNVNGVRQNQIMLEQMMKERHEENRQDRAADRSLLQDMSKRIDRLLERSGAGD